MGMNSEEVHKINCERTSVLEIFRTSFWYPFKTNEEFHILMNLELSAPESGGGLSIEYIQEQGKYFRLQKSKVSWEMDEAELRSRLE